MPFFDMPLEELKAYRPPVTRQPDFDAFWGETLSQSVAIPVDPIFEPVDFPARALDIYDVRYVGWHRAEIAGRYLVPQEGGPFPALLSIHGYSGYHRPIWPLLAWAYQGYAVLAVDVRGQSGDSTDTTAYSGHTPGYMTQGILDPAGYYYRGVYGDAVRAIDVLACRPEVDIHRLGVTGISQGGGCSLAVAALDRRVTACMAEVPYLCHFRRATTLTGRRPYDEIGAYVKMHPEREEAVFRTLSYFDNLNLADHITCPTLVTVGLMDEVCPPSTVFAAYNYIVAPKKLLISTFGEHESFPNVPPALLRWADAYVRNAPA
jgi:cephalosporin-C deacetylase